MLMNDWEAIQKRVSCRAYQNRRIEEATLSALRDLVKQLNEESGQHFQLIHCEGDEGLLKLSAAMFDGPVYTYAALVGGKDDLAAEKVGYYGHRLVMEATKLGLGSCWVAGTYDSKSVTAAIPEGCKLWDVIPLGYAVEKKPMKQKLIRSGIRARDRKLEQFVESDVSFEQLPEWIRRGAEAVKLGPSAVNQQPVNLVWKNGELRARLWKNARGLSLNDLGIAKYQFAAAAAHFGVKGEWEFGDGALFHIMEK